MLICIPEFTICSTQQEIFFKIQSLLIAISFPIQHSLLCKPFLHRHADAALLHVGDVSVPLGVPELVVLERLQSFEPIGQQLIS